MTLPRSIKKAKRESENFMLFFLSLKICAIGTLIWNEFGFDAEFFILEYVCAIWFLLSLMSRSLTNLIFVIMDFHPINLQFNGFIHQKVSP